MKTKSIPGTTRTSSMRADTLSNALRFGRRSCLAIRYVLALCLICLVLLPGAQAVVPPADGNARRL